MDERENYTFTRKDRDITLTHDHFNVKVVFELIVVANAMAKSSGSFK